MKDMNIKQQIKGLVSLLIMTSCLNLQAATPAEECKKLFNEDLNKQAIAPCTQAAELGDMYAQLVMGEIMDAEGNAEATARWWGEAAEAGHPTARNLLALKYYYGGTVLGAEEGWTQDYTKAFEIWKEDAADDVATSQFMLGVMYQKGQGVEKNLPDAWYWLQRSLGNGYKLSTDVLIEISKEITPEQKQQGKSKLEKYNQSKLG